MSETFVLSDKAVVKQKRLTQSIVKKWLIRMIDAGWMLTYEEPNIMFYHADESTVEIKRKDAEHLIKHYWRRLVIPSPYTLPDLLKSEPIKIDWIE